MFANHVRFLCAFTFLEVLPLFAQISTTASITGTVTDSSGGLVAGASVTALDQDTQTPNQAQTNQSGEYVFSALPVGTYSVTVTKSGFKTFTTSNVVLHPATVATVNSTLSPGEVGTSVTVSASAAEVQTTTSEVASEVTSEQIGTLPLNGRNFQALAAVMPGVQNLQLGSAMGTGGRATNDQLSVNGLATNTTFYALDGVWDENTGNMSQVAILPNPDTLEEVRVLEDNYSAKYSLMGASVVLLQTKSGTSQFHGSAFEYFRNDALNARNFFSPTVPAFKQSIFGYTLGGPVFIPGHYNTSKQKTFFFWSQQWVISHQGTTLTGQTVTSDQLNGVFTSAIKDPVTGAPFPQNAAGQYVIPQSRINSSALALMKAVYPLPNLPNGGSLNYVNLTPQIVDQRDDEIKVDHNFTNNLRLTGEFLDEPQTYQQSSLNGSQSGEIFPTNYETDLTRNKMAQLSLVTVISPTMVNTTSIATNNFVLYLNLSGTSYLNQVPGFSETLPFNGVLANRLPLITFSGGLAPEGIAAARPLTHAGDTDNTFTDDWNWLRGKHSVSAGINIVLNTKRQNPAASTNGQFSFSGQFTGNAIADYLLGDAATFTQQSTEPRGYIHAAIESPYFQDRIKLFRNFTVTLGLRITHMPLPYAQPNFSSLFEASQYNVANAPIVNANGTITLTPSYSATNGLVRNGVNGVPLNWVNNHNWYYSPSAGFAWDVLGDGKTSVRGGYGLTYTRIFTNQDCSFSCILNPPGVQTVNLVTPNFPNPAGTGSAAALSAPTLSSADTNIQATQVHSYSLSVEHQFAHDWVLSAAGVGTLARHIVATWNINQPYPDGPYAFNPIINTGTVFTYQQAPYLGYAAINQLTTGSTQNWNALELSVRHPMGKHFFFSGAYTWSHNLTDSAVVNVYNPKEYYGNAAGLNVPQTFSASIIYNLPGFDSGAGWQRGLLGGWKYTDITTMRSGLSLTPSLSISHQGLAVRPDVISSLSYPKTPAQWFSTASFAAPLAGYFGDAGSGVITGPAIFNSDMALFKGFHIKERHTIEFRAEFFNVFNHTNFTTVNTALGNASFGKVTAAADPRIMEMVLRYQF